MKKFSLIVAWGLGLLILAGWSSLALASPLPGPLTQRVQAACDRAHQAGLMHQVQVGPDNLLTLAGASCPQVRALSVYALGEIREIRAVPVLIERLGDQNKAVRRISARALGKIGDPEATEPLIASLDNPQEALVVRCTAAQALGQLSNIRAANALLRASKSEPAALRASATKALHGMEGFPELRNQMASQR